MSRIIGRKDASHFSDMWILIIHQVITYGSILNQGEIISNNLDIQLKKVKKECKFYMASFSYMLCVQVDNIHLLVGNGIQSFHTSMFIVKCYGRTHIRRIMKEFVMSHLFRFIRYFLVWKNYFSLLKGRRLYKNTVTST